MRLGVFGGTFDPPHLGHAILAAEARAQLALERVLWIPAGRSPFKQERALTPIDLRLAMVQAAIADDAGFALSRIDSDRPGPHYTADTLQLLGRRYPGAELFMLIGLDVLAELPDWRQPERILSRCRLAVARRPGVSAAAADLERLELRLPGLSQRVAWIAAPLIDIAASDIRRRVRAGRPYRYFVRSAVRQIIEARRLYQETDTS